MNRPDPAPSSRAGNPPAAPGARLAAKSLHVLLSQYVANGLTVSLGLVLIMLAIFEAAGLAAASTAAVGVMITSLPDVPAPRRRKIMQMLPAPLLGAPLFMLVQLARHDELLLGIVVTAATFLAVMMMAWGKRGGPICFSLLFSTLFSMAAPPVASLGQIALHGAWFLAGAGLYLLWAVLTTHLLNQRFRAQLLAECLHSFAQILRTQAQRFGPQPDHSALLARMLQQQAALADHLQNTRDVVLESPTTPERQRLAAMLLSLLEARDHQLACDLDLDFLLEHSASVAVLPALQLALGQHRRAAGSAGHGPAAGPARRGDHGHHRPAAAARRRAAAAHQTHRPAGARPAAHRHHGPAGLAAQHGRPHRPHQ